MMTMPYRLGRIKQDLACNSVTTQYAVSLYDGGFYVANFGRGARIPILAARTFG